MDVTTLYACLWLRSVVFNGEQQCTEPDLDGRELEPTTIIVWASVDGRPVGTLRVLDDKDHLVSDEWLLMLPIGVCTLAAG